MIVRNRSGPAGRHPWGPVSEPGFVGPGTAADGTPLTRADVVAGGADRVLRRWARRGR